MKKIFHGNFFFLYRNEALEVIKIEIFHPLSQGKENILLEKKSIVPSMSVKNLILDYLQVCECNLGRKLLSDQYHALYEEITINFSEARFNIRVIIFLRFHPDLSLFDVDCHIKYMVIHFFLYFRKHKFSLGRSSCMSQHRRCI